MIQHAAPSSAGMHIVQIGLNTCDLAGSPRLYREIFGFSNAGGNVIRSEVMRTGFELALFASAESRDELVGFRPAGHFVADFAASAT
jgi:hypothetical protein